MSKTRKRKNSGYPGYKQVRTMQIGETGEFSRTRFTPSGVTRCTVVNTRHNMDVWPRAQGNHTRKTNVPGKKFKTEDRA